ncbi:MAG: 30S ribosomal protein S9 [Candidatus Pacebacteria bacterium]|nr:30S ribosomal protein S9 [Candidatus Paceibacterota bacterium]
MATKQATKYFEAVGRRKTSVARVRIHPGSKKTTITVNEKPLEEFFSTNELHQIARDAFILTDVKESFDVTAKILGGGTNSQAEALRHGISRALIEFDPELRGVLKKAGFLKRDPRTKERRKFGLKKARKAPQWSKR